MKRFPFIIAGILYLAFAPMALASFTFDSSSTVKTFNGTTTATSSIIVGSGSNELLTALIGYNQGTAPSSVNLDGIGMTLATSVSINFGFTTRAVDVWYALAQAAGTHNASVTWAANKSGYFELVSHFGVNMTNPIDTTAFSENIQNSIAESSTITTNKANDLIIDATSKTSNPTILSNLNANQVKLNWNVGANSVLGEQSYLIATSSQLYKLGYNINIGVVSSTEVDVAFAAAPTSSSIVAANSTTNSATTAMVSFYGGAGTSVGGSSIIY